MRVKVAVPQPLLVAATWAQLTQAAPTRMGHAHASGAAERTSTAARGSPWSSTTIGMIDGSDRAPARGAMQAVAVALFPHWGRPAPRPGPHRRFGCAGRQTGGLKSPVDSVDAPGPE